jgi:hypothetical protein
VDRQRVPDRAGGAPPGSSRTDASMFRPRRRVRLPR